MGAHPSDDEIIAAIQKSGYLLEQEVASKIEALGFHVETNTAFTDPEEGKSREIDVRAFKQIAKNEELKIAVNCEFLIECKNTSNPFVFFGRQKNSSDNVFHRRPEFHFPIEEYEARKPDSSGQVRIRERTAFHHLGFDKVHYRFLDPLKAVQFCRIDRKGSHWRADHGGLYDSIFYPMAKAVMNSKQQIPSPQRFHDSWRFIWFIFPTVVLNSNLLFVDSEKEPIKLESREYVSFSRQIKSEHLSDRFSIDFVRLNALEKFYNECAKPTLDHAAKIVLDQPQFLLTKDIDWNFA